MWKGRIIKLKRTYLSIITVFALLLVGCSGQEKKPNEQVEKQSVETTNNEDLAKKHEDSVEGANQWYKDSVKENGKKNPLTEKEMIEIGKRLSTNHLSIYTINTEDKFQEWLKNYINPVSTEENYRNLYESNTKGFYTDVKGEYTDIYVYPYNETRFVFEAYVTYTYSKGDGGTESYKHRVINEFDTDENGEYKVYFLKIIDSPDNFK